MGVKIRKELAFRRVGGELFVVDSGLARLHELNGSAALIWEGLSSGKSEAGIASAMEREFEVDGRTALKDVKNFIRELKAAGLLEGNYEEKETL